MITVAKKIENTRQPVIRLGFDSSANEDIDLDALWLALLDEVRQPEAHAPSCSVTYWERELSLKEGTQHVSVKEEEREVIHRRVMPGPFLGDRSVQKECAKRIPTTLTHRHTRGVIPD